MAIELVRLVANASSTHLVRCNTGADGQACFLVYYTPHFLHAVSRGDQVFFTISGNTDEADAVSYRVHWWSD